MIDVAFSPSCPPRTADTTVKPLADEPRGPRAELDRLDLPTAGLLTAGPPQNQFSLP